jgi:large subunit ribosomal protein L17
VRTEREQHKLATILATRYRHREGGYTRVIHTRSRLGDAAPLSLIEFVDRPGELRTPRPPRTAARTTMATGGHSLLPKSAQPLDDATA